MTVWVTVYEAVKLLAEQGVTVRSKGTMKPPSRETVTAWCQKGILKAERKGGEKRAAIWLIDADSLTTFTPPKGGRPLDLNPSPLAQAQRESRRRRQVNGGQLFVSVTGDSIEPGVGETVLPVGEMTTAPLALRGVPCPNCKRRDLHHPKLPQGNGTDTSQVRCRFCGWASGASGLTPYVAAYHELQKAEVALQAAGKQGGQHDHT